MPPFWKSTSSLDTQHFFSFTSAAACSSAAAQGCETGTRLYPVVSVLRRSEGFTRGSQVTSDVFRRRSRRAENWEGDSHNAHLLWQEVRDGGKATSLWATGLGVMAGRGWLMRDVKKRKKQKQTCLSDLSLRGGPTEQVRNGDKEQWICREEEIKMKKGGWAVCAECLSGGKSFTEMLTL